MIAEFTIRISWWLLIGIILILAMAYFDFTRIGKATFFDYVAVCFMELLFVFIGFIIGINTK